MQVIAEQGRRPIKVWHDGVVTEPEVMNQLRNIASLPFVFRHVASMPDAHWGKGTAIGSVIPTKGAIIPASVGVDIGCGMMALQLDASASDLPDNLGEMRTAIERAVPHGRTDHGRANVDRGAWGEPPAYITRIWRLQLSAGHRELTDKYPHLQRANALPHLGTLGTGNHFIEVCLDEADRVWVMLHSGSRGIGNAIGSYFIELAREDMRRHFINLPDLDLAYLPEGTEHFDDYVKAVLWAQGFARANREIMMTHTLNAMAPLLPRNATGHTVGAVNCHHNYVTKENHFGENVWVTRKGAVCAREGMLGIIPGSMGTRSYIVRGKGNAESFNSCSHGAGRTMSRTQARKLFTLEDHARATAGVECRKDVDVIDETPAAYKDIDAVMTAQADLVTIEHTLKQVLCVKG